jgi:hypothetical protein
MISTKSNPHSNLSGIKKRIESHKHLCKKRNEVKPLPFTHLSLRCATETLQWRRKYSNPQTTHEKEHCTAILYDDEDAIDCANPANAK